MVSAPQRLPAIRRLARCNRGFALMMGAEAALALCIVRVAVFSILAVQFSIPFATHVVLSSCNVTKSTLAPFVMITVHVGLITQ